MGDLRESSSSSSSFSSSSTTSPPPLPASTLVKPSPKKKHIRKSFRIFRSVFGSLPIMSPSCRSLPMISPVCRLPSLPGERRIGSGSKTVTGTLFGYRKGRVTLAIQENPMTMPRLVIELAMQTNVLQKEMSLGMVRIALECEKRMEGDSMELLDEPMWTMFCNGRKNGYVLRRDELDEDLHVMEVLKVVSMGAGVLPDRFGDQGEDGEIAYIRSSFELVVGSSDTETYYMLSPDGNSAPELSIFFVRI